MVIARWMTSILVLINHSFHVFPWYFRVLSLKVSVILFVASTIISICLMHASCSWIFSGNVSCVIPDYDNINFRIFRRSASVTLIFYVLNILMVIEIAINTIQLSNIGHTIARNHYIYLYWQFCSRKTKREYETDQWWHLKGNEDIPGYPGLSWSWALSNSIKVNGRIWFIG